MAKALFGAIGNSDLRLEDEVRRLRTRTRDLESEVLRLQAENAALTAELAFRSGPALDLLVEPGAYVR